MVDWVVGMENHFILQSLSWVSANYVQVFYLQGLYLFGYLNVRVFAFLHHPAVVLTSVVWIIFCMVKGTIPTFDFWEGAEPSGVVHTVACSTDKRCFDYFSSALQGQGVFLARQEGTQVNPQLFVEGAFSVDIYVEVQGERTAPIFYFELGDLEGLDQVSQHFLDYCMVLAVGVADSVFNVFQGFAIVPHFLNHVKDSLFVQSCKAIDHEEEVQAGGVHQDDSESDCFRGPDMVAH